MTQAAKLAVFAPPTWTTAGRPSSPYLSQIGFNTILSRLEYWTGSTWQIM
jgi:hypothetical protein